MRAQALDRRLHIERACSNRSSTRFMSSRITSPAVNPGRARGRDVADDPVDRPAPVVVVVVVVVAVATGRKACACTVYGFSLHRGPAHVSRAARDDDAPCPRLLGAGQVTQPSKRVIKELVAPLCQDAFCRHVHGHVSLRSPIRNAMDDAVLSRRRTSVVSCASIARF